MKVRGRDPGRDEPELPCHGFTAFYDPSVPAEAIVDRWDYELSCRWYPGDSFPAVWPNFGAGVMAAFLGAELHPDGRTVWFKPPGELRAADIHFRYDPDNPWLSRIKDICRAAMQRWGGPVQVAMTDLGGTLDVLSTFRPGEQLLLDLYDHPGEVERLTWELHELWFRFFEEIDACLQPVNPGYTAWTPIYSESPYYMLQCDFCCMVSPAMFDRFVKPELSAACRRLANPFYHLDGPGQLPHLESLLAIPELKGVQWIPGAGAPDQRHWPEVYRQIRRAGKLIQISTGSGGLEVLDIVAEQIGTPRGIVLIGEVDIEEEPRLAETLRRYGAE